MAYSWEQSIIIHAVSSWTYASVNSRKLKGSRERNRRTGGFIILELSVFICKISPLVYLIYSTDNTAAKMGWFPKHELQILNY